MSAEDAVDKGERLIGQVLANRYHIEMRLGEGAMGSVYRAKHVKVGRPFAVKVLHKKLLEDKKVAQRFEREAELAGRLRHPNVVGVVDVGETSDGLRYMVMDFAEGEDLATILNEAPMPPERVIHLTRQMLEGLYHAHEAGLIHRDFKPENVIIEKDDHGAETPRIVDFGIAILREGGDSASATGRLTTNGLVLGTPHYMAPEQAVADPIDHRIDLFALGIVVYEMLSGRLPFDGTGAEIARANLLLDPPLISQRVPYLDVDPLLEAFARRLMAKKRDMRPPTAKAARELLDLIERDRTAAAAALNVPIGAARTSQITQDVVPHKPVNEDSGSYMVPSTPADSAVPAPRATDLEAPPLRGRPEAQIRTSPAEPLAWRGDEDDVDEPRPARRGWIIGGIAAVAAAAIIIVIVSYNKSDTPQPAVEPEHKVVMQPVAPPPVEVKPIEEAPTPVEVAVETDPVEPPVENATKPVETKPVKKPRDPVTKPKIATTPEVTKPADTKPAEVVKTVEKPVETKPEVKPEVKPESAAAAFANQYSRVGADLRALGDNAKDLWPRYRRINFNDAMTSADKRAEASEILGELAKHVASRK